MSERFGLPVGALERICQVLAAEPKLKAAKIFGSRARGDHRANSDIDICIIGQNLSFSDLQNLANQLDDLLLPWTIDLVLQSTIENQKLLSNIELDGIDICFSK